MPGMYFVLKTALSDPRSMNNDLDWNEIFRKRPDLKPPGYEEAVVKAFMDSQIRYERLGKKRAGSSGKSRPSHYPSLKHGAE